MSRAAISGAASAMISHRRTLRGPAGPLRMLCMLLALTSDGSLVLYRVYGIRMIRILPYRARERLNASRALYACERVQLRFRTRRKSEHVAKHLSTMRASRSRRTALLHPRRKGRLSVKRSDDHDIIWERI